MRGTLERDARSQWSFAKYRLHRHASAEVVPLIVGCGWIRVLGDVPRLRVIEMSYVCHIQAIFVDYHLDFDGIRGLRDENETAHGGGAVRPGSNCLR